MNEKNTIKLIKDFPSLYRGADKPPTESLMCFGFECGDGWFNLIYELSRKISEHGTNCEVIQVKEKFGGLRFYVCNGTDKIFDLIDEYEDMSYKTCENCGSTDNVTQTKTGWIKTLCKECMNKEFKL